MLSSLVSLHNRTVQSNVPILHISTIYFWQTDLHVIRSFCYKDPFQVCILLQHYELESENIQSIALLIGCKAKSLRNELKHRVNAQKSVVNGNLVDFQKASSIEVLSDVSDIVTSIKNMVSWLDR